MKTFELHWLTGKVDVVKGDTIQQAFTLAGYGGGALAALDYWKEI